MGIKHTSLPMVCLALAGLAAPWSANAADVTLVEARRGTAGTGTSIEAHLEPLRQATVSAQLGGNVLALLVKAGDRVKAGQALARIDERDAQAGVQRTEAGLTQAEAEARNARVAAERTRELRAQGFVSQAALDNVETQYKAAQAGVQQAQAARAQSTLARGFASVTAPFDGVVLATHLEAGDLASPGRAIATLYAPGALRAVAQVPLSQAELARHATQVEVELANGRRVKPLRQVELSSADAVSQTVEWRLDLPVPLPDGMPGQAARVHFSGAAAPTPAAQAPRLPLAAVLRRGELTAVYVAQGDQFALRAVRLGAERGDSVEVLAGLKAGEKVASDAVKAGLADARPAR